MDRENALSEEEILAALNGDDIVEFEFDDYALYVE